VKLRKDRYGNERRERDEKGEMNKKVKI